MSSRFSKIQEAASRARAEVFERVANQAYDTRVVFTKEAISASKKKIKPMVDEPSVEILENPDYNKIIEYLEKLFGQRIEVEGGKTSIADRTPKELERIMADSKPKVFQDVSDIDWKKALHDWVARTVKQTSAEAVEKTEDVESSSVNERDYAKVMGYLEKLFGQRIEVEGGTTSIADKTPEELERIMADSKPKVFQDISDIDWKKALHDWVARTVKQTSAEAVEAKPTEEPVVEEKVLTYDDARELLNRYSVQVDRGRLIVENRMIEDFRKLKPPKSLNNIALEDWKKAVNEWIDEMYSKYQTELETSRVEVSVAKPVVATEATAEQTAEITPEVVDNTADLEKRKVELLKLHLETNDKLNILRERLKDVIKRRDELLLQVRGFSAEGALVSDEVSEQYGSVLKELALIDVETTRKLPLNPDMIISLIRKKTGALQVLENSIKVEENNLKNLIQELKDEFDIEIKSDEPVQPIPIPKEETKKEHEERAKEADKKIKAILWAKAAAGVVGTLTGTKAFWDVGAFSVERWKIGNKKEEFKEAINAMEEFLNRPRTARDMGIGGSLFDQNVGTYSGAEYEEGWGNAIKFVTTIDKLVETHNLEPGNAEKLKKRVWDIINKEQEERDGAKADRDKMMAKMLQDHLDYKVTTAQLARETINSSLMYIPGMAIARGMGMLGALAVQRIMKEYKEQLQNTYLAESGQRDAEVVNVSWVGAICKGFTKAGREFNRAIRGKAATEAREKAEGTIEFNVPLTGLKFKDKRSSVYRVMDMTKAAAMTARFVGIGGGALAELFDKLFGGSIDTSDIIDKIQDVADKNGLANRNFTREIEEAGILGVRVRDGNLESLEDAEPPTTSLEILASDKLVLTEQGFTMHSDGFATVKLGEDNDFKDIRHALLAVVGQEMDMSNLHGGGTFDAIDAARAMNATANLNALYEGDIVDMGEQLTATNVDQFVTFRNGTLEIKDYDNFVSQVVKPLLTHANEVVDENSGAVAYVADLKDTRFGNIADFHNATLASGESPVELEDFDKSEIVHNAQVRELTKVAEGIVGEHGEVVAVVEVAGADTGVVSVNFGGGIVNVGIDHGHMDIVDGSSMEEALPAERGSADIPANVVSPDVVPKEVGETMDLLRVGSEGVYEKEITEFDEWMNNLDYSHGISEMTKELPKGWGLVYANTQAIGAGRLFAITNIEGDIFIARADGAENINEIVLPHGNVLRLEKAIHLDKNAGEKIVDAINEASGEGVSSSLDKVLDQVSDADGVIYMGRFDIQRSWIEDAADRNVSDFIKNPGGSWLHPMKRRALEALAEYMRLHPDGENLIVGDYIKENFEGIQRAIGKS